MSGFAAKATAVAAQPVDLPAPSGVLSPNFLLMAACCRWPVTDEFIAAVRIASNAVADWDSFLHTAKRHRVGGLVGDALRSARIAPPQPVGDELAALVEHNVRRGLKLALEAARLQNLLAGIPVLVLKGAALEQLAYTGLAAKQTRDIDLLVLPEDAEEAWQIIECQGYVQSPPTKRLDGLQRRSLISFGREIEFVHPQTVMRVELQWRAADNLLLLKGIAARSETQTVALSETVTLRTLSPNDLFAYLCVHGARHSWSRLKWLADLNALLVSSKADIEHLYRHAQKLGAGLCAAQGLLLCHNILGLKLPTALADELRTNKRHRKLVAVAMKAITAPSTGNDGDPGIRGVVCELRNRFLLGQGFRFYWTECRLALVGTADVVRLPLPRPLHFMYPIVRLPLWLWRRIKIALFAAPAPGMK